MYAAEIYRHISEDLTTSLQECYYKSELGVKIPWKMCIKQVSDFIICDKVSKESGNSLARTWVDTDRP